MTRYDEMQKQILLSISIEEVMSYFGKSSRRVHVRSGITKSYGVRGVYRFPVMASNARTGNARMRLLYPQWRVESESCPGVHFSDPYVEAYLDNDQAGSHTLKKMEDCLSAMADEVCVYDMRSLYESFKDLNERLMNDVSGHLCATNYTKHHGTNTFKGCPGETGQDQLG